jgi:DNA-binding response OmpR family regulator
MSDKILIVDDEPDILNLAKITLENEGFELVTASNGVEALEKAKTEFPDLIFLDVVMPGKSGLEVCNILKNQPCTKNIQIVMFTVLGRDIDKMLSMKVGADGHFTKPFTPDELVISIKNYLTKAKKNKFSKPLGITHEQLRGKKILLEFDPATHYERLVRHFTEESISNNEIVLVLTPNGSSLQQVLKDDKNIQIINITNSDTMLTPIIKDHDTVPLTLIYDSLTDLALSKNHQASYTFTRDALNLLSNPKMTALFLLNSSAHDEKEVSSIKGLFSDQLFFGKEGIVDMRFSKVIKTIIK